MSNIKEQFEYLVEKYSDVIYRVVYSYCKNRLDAEDIIQNTFFKLYTTQREFQSEEHIKNWLYRVAIHDAINLKKSKWYNIQSLPDDYYMETKEQKELYDDIMRLPNKYRIVILLYYYSGYKIKEIAQIINKKESTIQTWLQRGRSRLKEYILEDKNGEI